MSNLDAQRQTIAAKLTNAGVEGVYTDPRCTPPAILVGAPSILGSEGVGGWRVSYPIQILGRPPGDEESLRWMLDALEGVLGVYFGIADPRTIEHGGADVPSYTVTVTQSVTSPHC